MAEPLTPKHDRWHESGCATCTALDPLLLALNDIDHVDGAERDLIVRLAGGALDAARAAAPLDVERLAYVHHLTDTDDPGRAEQPWRECPWSKEHSAFAAEYARLGEDARRG